MVLLKAKTPGEHIVLSRGVKRILSPMASAPMISSRRMIPGACHPYPAWSGAAPIALMPGITPSRPDPIAIDPDVIGTGSYRAGINNASGLGLYIPLRCAAGEAQKAAGNGYSQ